MVLLILRICISQRIHQNRILPFLRRLERGKNQKVLFPVPRLNQIFNFFFFPAEFRYEAVAVIHKDLKLEGIEGIKGLNSCHTGVGRNVGYKIPLTKLKQKGIIGNLNEPDLSPRENELKAFSNLFNKACIVGKWSADPKINLEWSKYVQKAQK